MFPERTTDQVQGNGVNARVTIAQAKAHDAQHVPEYVVLLLGLGVVVEPDHEDVVGQKAHGKHQHERQHRFGHLFPSPYLTHLSLRENDLREILNLCNARVLKKVTRDFQWHRF